MFESVTLNYGGSDYNVPPERIWGLIAVVENKTGSIYNIARLITAQNYQRVYITDALHAALEYAGAKVSIDEIRSKPMHLTELVQAYAALFDVLKMAEPPADVDIGGDGQPGVAYNDVGKQMKTGKQNKRSNVG